LKKITVPVLVMHGDDDQIVPYETQQRLDGNAATGMLREVFVYDLSAARGEVQAPPRGY